MKESELPPPPKHVCRKPKPKEAQPTIEKQETKEAAGAKPKPVALCTRCGAVSYVTSLINGQCQQIVAGKRCVGVNGSALNADDWKPCTACGGAGSTGTARCGRCDGAGWLYARR